MSIRRIALAAFLDITDGGAYANLRLKQAAEGQEPRDVKWIHAAVYGALDHLQYIDYMLNHFTKGRQKPAIRGILRLGAHELLFMCVPPSAVCNEGVKLTKEIGKAALAGYVNAVLRALARSYEQDALPPLPQELCERLSVQYSWPRWIIETWVARLGAEETELLLRRRAPALSIRAQFPFTSEALADALAERHIAFSRGRLDANCFHIDCGFDVANMPLFREGNITVQGEGAMLACRACGVSEFAPLSRPLRVLDACAAPGGKTAYLYSLARGNIELHAWELHAHRKELLDNTLTRLHVCADTRLQDASACVGDFKDYFDIVLLDVPCSGLGVAHEKPDVRLHHRFASDIAPLAQIQAAILHTCSAYVRPGGILVYASCTISAPENEEQIAAFLKRNGAFRAENPPQTQDLFLEGQVQLLPHIYQTEGFFIARMRRKEE